MVQTITAIMLLALAPAPIKSDEELKRIEGEWIVVKKAWQGEPYETESAASIDRDNLSFRDRTGAARYRIKRIGSGEIDLIKETPPAVGEFHVGIYSLDGDKMKICFAVDGPLGLDDPPKRPTKFESPKGSGYIVYFLERKKTGKDEKK